MPRWLRQMFTRTRRPPASPMRRSAVLVRIPEAEPAVGEWRLRHTYDAPLGVPPHVTLLFPFVPTDDLTGEVEERLEQVISDADPFDVTFGRTARFPGQVSLATE